ncbi:hypothetical protein [Pedobacter sp.]|uniref:hypothetical protein n=1 Tax=Pedobacter sp. TaxID=1411316 RepID=UPI00396CF33D
MRAVLILLMFICMGSYAQDAVLISEGNFIRGVIQGTNFETVAIKTTEGEMQTFKAKDIRSFLWNGDTYESKPIIFNKKAEVRFFKLLEGGKVNLYSYGVTSEVEERQQQTSAKVKPSFGVGVGSGGFGGGVGGGISINLGGRRNSDETNTTRQKIKATYFIERPGSGPIQEIFADGTRTTATKTLLLQKLTGDEDLTERIKATDSFDDKIILAFVKSYNESVK